MIETVRIYNISDQMIPLQVKPPNGNFFTSEQQIRLAPNDHIELPKEYLLSDQIKNLKNKGFLKILENQK